MAVDSRLLSAGMGRRAPWAPRIGTYPLPAPSSQSLLDQLVTPPLGQQPAPFQPAPQQPAAPEPAPVVMGQQPINDIAAYGPEGLGGSPDAAFGMGEPSPNQSLSGVVDAGMSLLGLAVGGPLSMMAAPAVMGALAQRGATQPTMSLTSAIAQIMGYPTIGQIVQNAVSPAAQWGALPAPDPIAERAAALDMNMPAGSDMDYSGIGDVLGAAGIAPNPATSPALEAQWGDIAGAQNLSEASAGGWGGVADTLGAAGLSPDMTDPAAYAGMWGDIAAADGYGGGSGMGTGAQSAEGADAFGGWMTGGYSGDGPADQPMGPVHAGEGVLNAAAMDYYGDAARMAVAAINARAVPKSKLAQLVGGR